MRRRREQQQGVEEEQRAGPTSTTARYRRRQMHTMHHKTLPRSFMLLLLLLLLLLSYYCRSSNHGHRHNHNHDRRRSSSSRQTTRPPPLTTNVHAAPLPNPFGPFIHRGHTSVPGARTAFFALPEPIPVLDADTGLIVSIDTASNCVFAFCLSHLLQLPALIKPQTDFPALCTGGFIPQLQTKQITPLFPRPGIAHATLYQTSTQGECPIDLTLTGTQCANTYHGTHCAQRPTSLPLPDGGFVLPAGQTATWEATATAPFTAALRLTATLTTNGAGPQPLPSGTPPLIAYVRQATFPRVHAQPLRYDAKNSSLHPLSAPINVQEVQVAAIAPRQAFEEGTVPLRYFFTLRAMPQSAGVTITNLRISSTTCQNYFHGKHCQDHAYVLAATQSYPVEAGAFSDDGWFFAAPQFASHLLADDATADHDAANQKEDGLEEENAFSFSVGIAPIHQGAATPELYLRLGDVPSKTVFDMRDAGNVAGRARFYSSGTTNGLAAPWYIAIYAPKGVPRECGLWFNKACADDCSGNGVCGTDHICKCASGFSGYNCAIYSPGGNPGGNGGDKPFNPGATAAIASFCVIGVLGMLGAVIYFRRKRRQSLVHRMMASDGYLSGRVAHVPAMPHGIATATAHGAGRSHIFDDIGGGVGDDAAGGSDSATIIARRAGPVVDYHYGNDGGVGEEFGHLFGGGMRYGATGSSRPIGSPRGTVAVSGPMGAAVVSGSTLMGPSSSSGPSPGRGGGARPKQQFGVL